MKTIFIVAFSLLVFDAATQVNVIEDSTTVVKSTDSKTFFLYRKSDEKHLDELTKVITENWTYNKMELVSSENFNPENVKTNDFIFSINYSNKFNRVLNNPTYYANQNFGSYIDYGHYVSFFLGLSQKNDSGYTVISKSDLSISRETLIDVYKTDKTTEEIIRNQYLSSRIFSWNYPYLGTVMNLVSTALVNGVTFSSDQAKNPGLSHLKENTLYVSDCVEIVVNRYTTKDKKVDRRKQIDKVYDYPFEIVSTTQLNELVISKKEGYVLMLQKGGTGKKIVIIDLSTMNIIYQKETVGKYKFEKKDMKKLNKVLSQLN